MGPYEILDKCRCSRISNQTTRQISLVGISQGLWIVAFGDGRRLAVGDPGDITLNIGLVAFYIFNEDIQDWNNPYLLKGQIMYFDYIGHDVSIFGDGNTLTVSIFKGNLKHSKPKNQNHQQGTDFLVTT